MSEDIKIPVKLYAEVIESITMGLRFIPLGHHSSYFIRRVLRELKGEPELADCGCVQGKCVGHTDQF